MILTTKLERQMNIKKINQFLVLLAVSLILSGCVVKDGKIVMKNKKEPFKHNTPLIKVDMKTKMEYIPSCISITGRYTVS